MVTVDSWASRFYGISQMSGPQCLHLEHFKQQVFHHRVQSLLWQMHSFSGGVTQVFETRYNVSNNFKFLSINSMQNLVMEQQRRPDEKDHMLTLATRSCLFRLLSFLDSRLPDSSAVIFTKGIIVLAFKIADFLSLLKCFSDSFLCTCGSNYSQSILSSLLSAAAIFDYLADRLRRG